MPYDQELIAREQFLDMIQQQRVIRFPAGHGGIIHEVKRLLERNAATVAALADNLRVDSKTVHNAIAHLRGRYNLKIRRYYNPKDRKYYYFLDSTGAGLP